MKATRLGPNKSLPFLLGDSYWAAPMAESPRAIQVNLRCTYEEERVMNAACDALHMNVAYLVEVGILQACMDLGMTLLDDAPPRLKSGYVWPWEPKRPKGEAAKARLTGYIPAAIFPTVQSAAWATHLSMPLFCIGSALRHIALAKVINERRQKSEPSKYNPKLAKVVVPYGFDDLVRTTRH